VDLGLEGRVALVMGASRGIGRAIAIALAREGARVALASRSREALVEAAAETDRAASAFAAGAASAVFEADTADLARLARLPDEVAGTLGPVEVLVANTGGPPPGATLDADLDTWREAYAHLVLAPRVLIEAVLPGMRERRWGRIVNVGSSSTIEPIPHLALSNAHRLATVGLFKTLAREVAGDGVTVNTVATGKIDTDRAAAFAGSREAAQEAAREQVPAGRLGKPEEYADLVTFLCSDRAGYLTGTVIPFDGGLMRSV
jgi:3-oxoacyl-[acyl-carrier protein] reductase